MTVVLRFPFWLPEQADVAGLQSPVETAFGDGVLRLSREHDHFLLELDGLRSEKEAQAKLRPMWRGLSWAMLGADLPFTASLDAQVPVPIRENVGQESGPAGVGVPIEMAIDGGRPAVVPSEAVNRPGFSGDFVS